MGGLPQATIRRITSDGLGVRLGLILLTKSAKTVCQNRLPKPSSETVFRNRLPKSSSKPSSEIVFRNRLPKSSSKIVFRNRLPKSSSKIVFQNRFNKTVCKTVLTKSPPESVCQNHLTKTILPNGPTFNDCCNMDYNSLSTRFACPFRLCTKTYSRKNELKVHVAKARLKKGDDCHPENDHLWGNPYVQSLLVFGTHARTPAEKRQKRQERNKRYRRKNEWRQNLKVFSANTSGVCPFYKY